MPAHAGTVRLTERQFRNSVAALFPFHVEIGLRFPSAPLSEGFSTAVVGTEVAFSDLLGLAETAESIGAQAAARLRELLPCDPAPDEAACVQRFIDGFAPRAFRRPLEPAERQRLVDLYQSLRKPPKGLPLDLAIAGVIAAVLQSPQFLYRLELGTPTSVPGVRRLSPYEVASRLSYLYWDAPPDAVLLEKARTGALAEQRVIEAETRRLLDDPRARGSAWRFLAEWLGFGEEVFEGRVDAPLAADFAEEARRLVLGTVFDQPGSRLRDLFDTDRTTVNRRLALHYGLATVPASDAEWRPVTLPPAQRFGVLGRAQVAVAHSAAGDTSVVRRGKFVNENLLCFDIGLPPPNAQSRNPVLPAEATARDRVEARLRIAMCEYCHEYLDYVGLGMEDVDHFGRYRTRYASGRALDPTGKLEALEGGDPGFVGTAGLAKKLAGSGALATCLTQNWYRYALGREATPAEAKCHVRRMNKRFADAGYSVKELLFSLSTTDALVYRTDAPAH
jgi:hypothetical protein